MVKHKSSTGLYHTRVLYLASHVGVRLEGGGELSATQHSSGGGGGGARSTADAGRGQQGRYLLGEVASRQLRQLPTINN